MTETKSNVAARLLTAAALSLVLALALAQSGAAPARAAGSDPVQPGAPQPGGTALMTVMGVVAPYSTFGLLKHLTGIKGVKEVHFDLRHGLARVQLLPGAVVTDAQLRAAVRSASYTPGDISWVPAQPVATNQ